MRAITPTMRAIMAGRTWNVRHRVRVEDPDGVMRDVTAFLGVNWLKGAEWSGHVDQPCVSGVIRLARVDQRHGISLAPAMAGSIANRNSAQAYAPFLKEGRTIEIQTAVVPSGQTPIAGDWFEIMRGRIDWVRTSSEQNEIQLDFRDPGAVLLDHELEEARTYAEDAPMSLEAIIQQSLDDEHGAGVYSLYVPVASGTMMNHITVDVGRHLERLRDIAMMIGWDLRYEYDNAGVMRLTLREPRRDFEPGVDTPDTTFAANEYTAVPRLDIGIDDIRNWVRVRYTDIATGERDYEDATDPVSILEYGKRFMELSYASDSNINTAAEAATLAGAARDDLSTPYSDHDADTVPLYWPAQVMDVYEFAANGKVYDDPQIFAVVGYTHAINERGGTTRFVTKGKVVSAIKEWVRRSDQPMGTELPQLHDVGVSWDGGALEYYLWALALPWVTPDADVEFQIRAVGGDYVTVATMSQSQAYNSGYRIPEAQISNYDSMRARLVHRSDEYLPGQWLVQDFSLPLGGGLYPGPPPVFSFGDYGTAGDAATLGGQPPSWYLDLANHTGTLADARLSSNVALRNAANTFTQEQTISKAAQALTLSGASAYLIFTNPGVNPPAFTTRSNGAKLVLYPALTSSAADYALGISSGTLWYGIPTTSTGQFHRWYGGTTELMSLRGDGLLTTTSGVTIGGGALWAKSVGAHVFGDVGNASLSVVLRAAAGAYRQLYWYTDALPRWNMRANASAESGSDAGSDFELYGYSDAGSATHRALYIGRAATGYIMLGRDLLYLGRDTDGVQSYIIFRSPAGTTRGMQFQSGTSLRWVLGANNASESGSNAGSNWIFNAYSDAGAFIDAALTISRSATGTVTLNRDLVVGSLGTFDKSVAPDTGNFLAYNTANNSKWRPVNVQLVYSSSDTKVSVGADGTSYSYVLDAARTGSGVTPATPIELRVVAGHKSITLDWSTTPLTDTIRYRVEYSTTGAFGGEQIAVLTSSRKLVHARLTVGTNYYYRVRAEGGANGSTSPTLFSAYRNAATFPITVVANSDASAFGSIIAAEIAVSDLAAINANLGRITGSGIIQNNASDSATRTGMRLSSGFALPSGWTGNPATAMYLDLAATGVADVVHFGNALHVRADGSATFGGQIELTNGIGDILWKHTTAGDVGRIETYYEVVTPGPPQVTKQGIKFSTYGASSPSMELAGGNYLEAGLLLHGALHVDQVARFAGDVHVTGNLSAATITGSYTVNASDLVGTTLASNVVTSSLTTVGALSGVTVNGNLTFSGASRNIVQGTTNFAIRNNANNANNLLITDAGAVTFRSTVGGITTLTATSVSAGGFTATGGNAVVTFTGSAANHILWPANGVNPPAFTTRSAGTKLVLYPNLTSSAVDYGIGIESTALWYSVPQNNSSYTFYWYGGTTRTMSLRADGLLTLNGTATMTYAGATPRVRLNDTDGSVNKRMMDVTYVSDVMVWEARDDGGNWLRDLFYIYHDGATRVVNGAFSVTAGYGVYLDSFGDTYISQVSDNIMQFRAGAQQVMTVQPGLVSAVDAHITASGYIRSTSTSGWVVGELANVQRITYASDSFALLTAANGYAHLKFNSVRAGGDHHIFGYDALQHTWSSNYVSVQLGQGASFLAAKTGASLNINANAYYDGVSWKAMQTGPSTIASQDGSNFYWYTASSVAAGAAVTLQERVRIDTAALHSFFIIRATGWYSGDPGAYGGLGFEAGRSGSGVYVYAYNRVGGVYGPMEFGATAYSFQAGHVTLANGNVSAKNFVLN